MKALLNEGLVTQEDFDRFKRRLLGGATEGDWPNPLRESAASAGCGRLLVPWGTS